MTQDLKAFLILQKKSLITAFAFIKQKNWPKLFVFASFLFIAFIIALFTYFFTRAGFRYLQLYPEFQQSIVYYILAAWFFLIFILTLGSSFISSTSILFAQDDDSLLLSSPISHQIIFESRLTNLIILSSWPVVIFGIPLILAFTHSFQLDFPYFFISFTALIIILLISTFIASILALKATFYIGRVGKTIFSIIAVLALPLLAWLTSLILLPPNLIQTFEKLEFEKINHFLKSLPISSSLFPSTWALNFVYYAQNNLPLALLNMTKLLLLLIVAALVTHFLVKKEYHFDLSQARLGRFIAGAHDFTKSFSPKASFPYFLKGIKGAFLEKDILIFTRSQAEIMQAGFIFFISFLYFLILSRIPIAKLAQTIPDFSIFNLIKINFLFNSFILTILSLRFVFPSISLEGQSAWIIWSAPFVKAKLFWQKLLTGWVGLIFISYLISLATTFILNLNFQFLLSYFIVLSAISLGLVAINLGLGIIFPNFQEKNPEKISTSIGGIFATIVSLFYIYIIYRLLFFTSESISSVSLIHLSIWVKSIIILTLFSYISLRKIEKYQF